jgi:recombination protein RecA
VPKKKSKKAPGAKVAAPKETRSLTERMRDELRKQFGDDAAATLGQGGYSSVREVMPTGLDVLDHWVIGIGGLPYGRIVEISGPEDTGKSSLVNHLMRAAQKDGAVASLGDSERKVQPNWVDVFQVDKDAVLLLPARTIEEYLGEVMATIKKFGKRNKVVFFLDSVATAIPKKALDEDLADSEIPGAMAAAWSRGLRQLNPLLSESKCMLILVSQLRSKIGVMFGPTEETAGGRAIKYYSSLRLAVGHGKSLKDGDRHVGKWAGVRAFKNHLGPNHRKAGILLNFEKGWDNDRSLLMYAKEMGIIDRKCRSVKDARKGLGWGYDEAAPDVVIEDVEPKEKT